jgi:hypothetical protein
MLPETDQLTCHTTSSKVCSTLAHNTTGSKYLVHKNLTKKTCRTLTCIAVDPDPYPGPDSILSLDPNPDSQSGSGSRRAKVSFFKVPVLDFSFEG